MPKGRPKKDKYADLDSEFKAQAETMDEAKLRDSIAKISLDLSALLEAQEADQDLQMKKEIAKEAGAIYREGKKFSKLATSYLRAMLDAKGKECGSFDQDAGGGAE